MNLNMEPGNEERSANIFFFSIRTEKYVRYQQIKKHRRKKTEPKQKIDKKMNFTSRIAKRQSDEQQKKW